MVPRRAIAVVPAYNEEQYLARTLDGLCEAQRSGALARIVVVDDGSKDLTAEIARGYGVGVVTNKAFGRRANKGKLYSFVQGLRAGLDCFPDVVLASDADLLNLTGTLVEDFLGMFHENSLDMLIGTCRQGVRYAGARAPPHLSGFRAIRADLLAPMHDRSRRQAFPWMDRALALRRWRGYALETVINAIVPADRVRYVDLHLDSREIGMGSCGAMAIEDAIDIGRAITGASIRYGKDRYLGVLEARKA